MARPRIHGLKRVVKRRADGSTVTYWYDRETNQRVEPSADMIALATPAPAPAKPARQVAPMDLQRAADTAGRTLRAAYLLWTDSPEWRALAASSRTGYARAIEVDCREMLADPIASFEREGVAKFIGAIAEDQPGRARKILRALSSLCQWLTARPKAERWIDVSFTHGVRDPDAIPHAPWSDDEIALAMTRLPAHMRRVIALALWTGARTVDLVAMRWSDFDPEAGTITYRPVKTETARARRERERRAKRGLPPLIHSATAHLGEEAVATLRRWKAEARSLHIVTKADGTPFRTAKHLQNAYIGARAHAGLRGRLRTLHGLRATALTRLAEAGLSERDMMAFSGHRDAGSLAGYISAARKAEGAARAGRVLAAALPSLRGAA